MGELRNVIVFTIGAARYAVELRWVREVVSLGFVTGVPTAPGAVGGVCNLHGTILPVLDVGALLSSSEGGTSGPPARQGDGALVIETEGVLCALRVDQVDHVASLQELPSSTAPIASSTGVGRAEGEARTVLDAGGRSLVLLDPARLVRRAVELVAGAASHTAEPPP